MRSLRTALFLLFCAYPLAAQADRNPHFDEDAKPILRQQRGLIDYINRRFEVQDTGLARTPGSDERRPYPPFIFFARPRGYSGDYYITLMVQPGPAGHILKVVDPTRAPAATPASGPYRPIYPAGQNEYPTAPPETGSEPVPAPNGALLPVPVPPVVANPSATIAAPSPAAAAPMDAPPPVNIAPTAGFSSASAGAAQAGAAQAGGSARVNPDSDHPLAAAPPVPTSPPPPDGAPPDFTSSTPSGTISPNGQVTPFPSPPTNTPSLEQPPTTAP